MLPEPKIACTGCQPGVLAPVAAAGRYVVLGLEPAAAIGPLVERLAQVAIDDGIVIGIGEPLVRALGVQVAGLRTFPALSAAGVAIPSTQGALFVHVRGDDQGELLRRVRRLLAGLGDGLRLDEDIVAFRHLGGHDLSGFEDGTENPVDAAAVAAAIDRDGASFVAVQRWIHDLGQLERRSGAERDALMGRNLETNVELDDAPPGAHVKRAAQESYQPAAFMVRRSMPYGSVGEHGLYFVAFGRSLDAYERVLTRMAGHEDGVVDGLFQFSRPVSGGYYWCPPLRDGRLDLRALGR
jgi:putative iron-dependent peroxidase